MKEKENKTIIFQGLILSILLLLFANTLYKITFNHASLDNTLYINVKIPFIDDRIPVIPLFFIGYNLAFIFWFLHHFLYSFTSSDPSYSSCLVSNLGSIKLPVMYHHLNNYGTNSCVVTIGEIRKAVIITKDGKKIISDVIKLRATMDERIADGFYFSKSVKILDKVITYPEFLLKPIKEENEERKDENR